MNFTELSKNRFTVREFSTRPLEKEKLDELLAVAMLAPTAKNFQPFKIYVLQSDEALKKLDTLTPCRYGATTVLVLTYDRHEEWNNPYEDGVHSGVEDVSIVATHIMLKAAELGVDSAWCNMFPNTSLEIAFDIPENERSVLFMDLGYRADGAKMSPNHENSKKLEDVVKYI